MTRNYTRREMLKLTGRAVALGAASSRLSFAADPESVSPGLVAGQLRAAEAGNRILREGGNAIDAAVAAAFVAAVTVPNGCGIGGYGGHMLIALRGKKAVAIDYNSAAPAAARPDMFSLDETGKVPGKVNEYGWRATGVPGILAGFQLALDHFGTRSFRDLVAPAIALAEDGFPLTENVARGIAAAADQLRADPASARLVLKDGKLLQGGEIYRNPDLAKMLGKLAGENSVESFYRGDIARHIAAQFQKHGGLVTEKDMAAYSARQLEPLELEWRGFTIRTAPLTAGGLTVIEALSILKATGWDKMPAGAERGQTMVEALRSAWSDRLNLLGDPDQVKVPVERLLSAEYAQSVAAQIAVAVRERRPLPLQTNSRAQTGTVHLNSADRHGNLVALTFTHGNTFGACVTVDGLGLTLGHGMSRFEPQPNHPNAPGPGKRPLHNMCPTIVSRDQEPVLAVGATGGRKIPSTVFNLLTEYLGNGRTAQEAVAAPRLLTEGSLELTLDSAWPEPEVEHLKTIGYAISNGPSAIAHALSLDQPTGTWRAVSR